MSNIAIFSVSENGARLARLLAARLNTNKLNAHAYILAKYCSSGDNSFESLSDITARLFGKSKALIFIMAHGIAARAVAPHLKSKYSDPAVVVLDDAARFVISSVSGHEGGANELAFIVSNITGATPVITTATEADKLYVAGVGARKGVSTDAVIQAITSACADAGIKTSDLRLIASAWVKQDEHGIIETAKQLNIQLRFLPKFLYDACATGFQPTAAAKHFDISAVAEPSAAIAAHNALNTPLVLPLHKYESVTVAIAKDIVGIEYAKEL
ncbi:hypothetical protein RsTz2092_06710 [Deferribacterales bacterium RsTz2092]|nr:hypothetical protein AGMMS49941_05480 [Deferribacterales bacterium]